MTRTYAGSGTRALIERHGIKLTKSLGQNLLTDKNIIRKIAACSDLVDGDTVVEVGPGLGALTSELAECVGACGRVIAVEIDRRIIPALRESLGSLNALGDSDNVYAGGEIISSLTEALGGLNGMDDSGGLHTANVNTSEMETMGAMESSGAVGVGALENVEIVHADFLDYDLDSIPGEYKLTGNLPYYVTTPVIMKAIESAHVPSRMVFMIQKEVAERITASPGGKDYGAVSVAVQYRCETEYAFDVSREVFLPKPNVDSAVIVLTPFAGLHGELQAAGGERDHSAPDTVCGKGDHSEPQATGGEKNIPVPRDEKLFFDVVKAGFGQRRKMLRNALSKIVIDKEALEAAFTSSGIKGTARAETLSVAEFIALSDAIKEVSDGAQSDHS